MKAETMAAPAVMALSSPSSSSLVNGADDELRVTKVLFKLPWKMLSLVLLLMPLASMLICLFTSMVMHGDHINNTICKVYNFLPSISAVTGVSPQRYLWRVCVALHISPRLLVAWVAKSHYVSLAGQVPAARRPSYLTLVFAAFYLNLTELFTLCGVTYISNKENYPVHEKLFTLFMLCSLVYMLCVIRVVHAVRHTLSPSHQASFYHKKLLFATKLAATFGLLFFFWRHRVLCEPKAFSWFSLCEYVLATCNMLYHVSVALDFSEEHVIVGHVVKVSPASSATSLSSPTIAQLHDTVSSPTASLNTYGRGPNIPSVPLTTCDVHLRPSSKSGDSFEGDLVPNTTHKDSMHDPISEASIKDEKNLHLSINVSEATQPATSTISTSSEINVVSSANTVSQDSVDVDAAEVTDVKAANSVGVETCNIKPEHIVHQVLNTIHEDLETSHHNGPTDTIIQRRPQTQSIESIAQTNENDAQRLAPNIHAHSE